MKKDFISTFLTQIIVLISGLAVFKLANIEFGSSGFSEFSLVKRNIAYLYTFIMLGLGVAVPRYIAKEVGTKSGNENNVFFAAFFISFISLVVTGLIFFIFQKNITFLLFGDKTYTKFLFPIFIMIAGLLLNGIVYSYYRGKMIFNYANFFQLINTGIVPLVAFLFSNNVEKVFLYTGLLMLTVNVIILLKIFITQNFDFVLTKALMPELFLYGLQRIPADFGLASLLALPAIFSAHTQGVEIAGYVAFSISLLSLSGQAVAPIGLIMLPKISHLIGEGNYVLIRHYVIKLLIFSVGISILGTFVYQIFASQILHLYLGKVDNNLLTISKSIMWGALFYPIYVTLRSVIDAYYKTAYNTVSIIGALLVYLIINFFYQDIFNALFISLVVLGLGTVYLIKLIFQKTSLEYIS
jgi:O-antigen/teichoic acid export membrane protein